MPTPRSTRDVELLDLRTENVHLEETEITIHFRDDRSFFFGDVMLNGFLEFADKDSKMLVVSRLPDLENEMSRLGVLLSGLVRERATSGYTLAERGIDDLFLRRRVPVKLVADLQRYASASAAVEIRKQRLDRSVILLQQVTNVCHVRLPMQTDQRRWSHAPCGTSITRLGGPMPT
jgi:hypothetical protein